MGRAKLTFQTDELTRSRWDQLKLQIRSFLNTNADIKLVMVQYIEIDPP